MKFTFADSPSIDELTFKKLMLTSSEIVMVGRPSISLATNYGTVGVPSGLGGLAKQFEGSPINLKTDEPPGSTFNSEYYKEYFKKDLQGKEFLNIILEGIKYNWIYDSHFKDEESRCLGEFKNYKRWILDNKDELLNTDLAQLDTPEGEAFRISTKEEALFAFKIIAAEESLRVTSVLYICNKYNNDPISINPYLDRLINLRISNEGYVGKTPSSRSLGFKVMDCFISDDALQHIHWTDILSFRERTKPYFEAWEIEINKLESQLFEQRGLSSTEIQRLFDSNINPRLWELETEIRQIRDEQFKNILKTVKNSVFSLISLGTLSSLSIPGAIAAFFGLNLKTPHFTDEIIENQFKLKYKKLSNGLTYLLELKKLT